MFLLNVYIYIDIRTKLHEDKNLIRKLILALNFTCNSIIYIARNVPRIPFNICNKPLFI